MDLDFDEAEEKIAQCYPPKALEIFKERYCLKGERVSDAMWRVAKVVAGQGMGYRAMEYFYELLTANNFMPNTPTWTGAGTRLNQLAACFVLPIEDDMISIFDTLRDAALIQKSGGGVGFNFGHLRPEGSLIESSGGISGGPVSFLAAYDAVFSTVMQGSRRGACMGIMPHDHADVHKFINCKRQEGKITNFNLSISVTDDFMRAVECGGTYKANTLQGPVDAPAEELFSHIVNGAWTNGEPGVLFIDSINRSNPAPEALRIEATNPCVTADTVVHTMHGAATVGMLVGKSFITIDNDAVPGGFFETKKTTELLKITTERGYSIKCTPNHVLYSAMGWEKAENLTPGLDAMVLQMAAPDRTDYVSTMDQEETENDTRAGWSVASGNYSGEQSVDEDRCRVIMNTSDFDDAVVVLKNIWMYSGRPHGLLSIGRCSEDTAQAVHLLLLRLCIMSDMRKCEDGSWEFVPIPRHAVAFFCIVCQSDMDGAIALAAKHIRKMCKVERDLVKTVERLTVEETPVYDATCASPTNHCLHTNGFVSHNCGEIPLSPYESCCLGSINLSSHVSNGFIKWGKLEKTVRSAVRFLDGVIDANGFVPSVPSLRKAALNTRRIGLGIMGLADLFLKIGVRYGSPESISVASQVMEFIRYNAMYQSMVLATQKGPFPAIKQSKYADNSWETPTELNTQDLFGVPNVKYSIGREETLDWADLRRLVGLYGVRNITTTAIAPTGTLSLMSGVSGFGCEPIFGLVHKRRIIDKVSRNVRYMTMLVPELLQALKDHNITDEDITKVMEELSNTGSCKGISIIPEDVKRVFVCASDVSADEHVMMQAALQRFVDSAISKTVNMPAGTTKEEVKNVFMRAWRAGCKGICVYVAGSRNTEVLSVGGGDAKK